MYFFWRLFLAHLLGDFTFQTNRIARWKREDVSGVFFHVLIFLFFAVLINYEYLPRKDFALALLALGVTHLIEDQWRVVSVNKYHSYDNLGLFLYDQFIHILLIFVLAPPDPPHYLKPEKWVLLGIVFVAATHFSTIFIFFFKKMFDQNAAIVTQEKYQGIVERLIVGACFLIPGPIYWVTLPVIVCLVIAQRLSVKNLRKDLDYSALNLALSNGLAVLFSILARFIYLSY